MSANSMPDDTAMRLRHGQASARAGPAAGSHSRDLSILFLTHYYPPEVNAPASRTSEHCKAWVREGHEVTVVTCQPNHPEGKIYPGYRNRFWAVEMLDGVRVIRLWTFLAANEGFGRRTLNYLVYLLMVILALPRLPRADMIVSTSPQFFCGLAGWFVRLVKRVPWVLEIRDLWPESIVTVGAMRRSPLTRVLEALETFAYRRADAIVAVTNAFVPHITARLRGSGKVHVIKNGVDLSHFDPSSVSAAIRSEAGLDGKVVAAYVGTHGMAHGLETILEAAALLKADDRIRFLLVGGGAERARLVKLKADRGLDNVVMLDQQPKSAMPGVWAATDISLIVLRRNDTFKKVLPSKMFEAMAMRRPIVLGVEGEARELLEEAGGGIGVTPENAEELAAAVLRLADDPALRETLGASGAAHVREHYDRSVLAARYGAILDEVVAPRGIARSVAGKSVG